MGRLVNRGDSIRVQETIGRQDHASEKVHVLTVKIGWQVHHHVSGTGTLRNGFQGLIAIADEIRALRQRNDAPFWADYRSAAPRSSLEICRESDIAPLVDLVDASRAGEAAQRLILLIHPIEVPAGAQRETGVRVAAPSLVIEQPARCEGAVLPHAEHGSSEFGIQSPVERDSIEISIQPFGQRAGGTRSVGATEAVQDGEAGRREAENGSVTRLPAGGAETIDISVTRLDQCTAGGGQIRRA